MTFPRALGRVCPPRYAVAAACAFVCLALPAVSQSAEPEAGDDVPAAVAAARGGRVLEAARLAFVEGDGIGLGRRGAAAGMTPSAWAELKIAFLSCIDTLRSGLADPDPRNRMAALKALGFAEGADAAAGVAALLVDADAAVRSAAALTLGEAGGFGHEAQLAAAAADADDAVRSAALWALRQLGAGEAVAVVALEDESARVRSEAARLLAQVQPVDAGLKTAAASALDRALSDEVAVVRSAAAHALGRLRHRPSTDGLARLAADADATVAVTAIEALGDMGGPEACVALIAVARGTGAYAVRAIGALGRTGERSGEVVAALTEFLTLGAAPIARAAAHALGSLGGELARDALVAAAARKELLPAVALAASHLGELRPAGMLLRQLDARGGWPSLTAARALAEMGNPAGFGVFVDALSSDDVRQRTYAAACLALYSGENRDFVPGAAASEKAAVAESWRQWWLENRDEFVVVRERLLETR